MNIFSNYSFLVAAMMGFVTLMYFRSQKTITRTSILDLYSKDLTKLARSGKIDPVIGRSAEISRVIQILCRRTKNNPVLVGDSGVGKTAIVEELANEIAQGRVPSMIKNKRLLQLDLSGLVAGTKYRGEFEKRLTAIVNEIIASQRSIILFIDEIHTLAEAGEASGAIDASDILKPALARGQLQAIGATTKEEYKMITQEKTLERRFQPVYVKEPSVTESIKMIEGLVQSYQKHHQVTISADAVKAAVMLSARALPDRHLPDKAIDLIDEASAKVHLSSMAQRKATTGKLPTVTAKDIREVLTTWVSDLNLLSKLKK